MIDQGHGPPKQAGFEDQSLHITLSNHRVDDLLKDPFDRADLIARENRFHSLELYMHRNAEIDCCWTSFSSQGTDIL